MIKKRAETSDQLLVFQASDTLTREDYEKHFLPELEMKLSQGKSVSMVLYLDEDFKGWELGVMWEDANFGYQHKDDFQRIAIVGADSWLEWIIKISVNFIQGQLKFFPVDQFDRSIEWSKATSEYRTA